MARAGSLTTINRPDSEEGIGLYVHVPFCKTKCPYCDFNTYQGIDGLMGGFLDAVTTELALWGSALGRPKVRTVFFGGGTPSYLPQGYIGSILGAAREAFRVDDQAECTIEANPGDLDLEACRELLRQGVSRLSIGVQSLDNDLLSLLGRRHTADEALAALGTARRAGFDNVNLDLMYGLPHQTIDQWRDTIGRLADHTPEHVSLYALTIEEGTPMHRWAREGRIPEPDPDLAADMYSYARELLRGRGYHHYEISNWCLPGMECRHNLVYWRNEALPGSRSGRPFPPRRLPLLDGAIPPELRLRSRPLARRASPSLAPDHEGRIGSRQDARRVGTHRLRHCLLGDDVPGPAALGRDGPVPRFGGGWHRPRQPLP